MVGQLIVAAAGSGKTQSIIDDALASVPARVLLTTYTNRNTAEIATRLRAAATALPGHIDVYNWCTFLFRHGVAPYQHVLSLPGRLRHVSPDSSPAYAASRGRPARADVARYFLDSRGRVYNDRVSDLACRVEELSKGLVTSRLRQIFSHVYIDEAQDLAGWDLTFVELLLRNLPGVTLVGDPRQRTYATTTSTKNAVAGSDPFTTMKNRFTSAGLVTLQERSKSYRSNQLVCDFADRLYLDQPKTTGLRDLDALHAGVFLVCEEHVPQYVRAFQPVVLRWSVASGTLGLPSFNYGESKGSSYDRVLVFPTKPILKYVISGEPLAAVSKAKFYVAVTRARNSVGIVVPDKTANVPGVPTWTPG